MGQHTSRLVIVKGCEAILGVGSEDFHGDKGGDACVERCSERLREGDFVGGGVNTLVARLHYEEMFRSEANCLGYKADARGFSEGLKNPRKRTIRLDRCRLIIRGRFLPLLLAFLFESSDDSWILQVGLLVWWVRDVGESRRWLVLTMNMLFGHIRH